MLLTKQAHTNNKKGHIDQLKKTEEPNMSTFNIEQKFQNIRWIKLFSTMVLGKRDAHMQKDVVAQKLTSSGSET